MFSASVLRYALSLLVPLSLILTSYLYLYPVFNFCAFPAPDSQPREPFLNTLRQHSSSAAYDATLTAPFRLLALGDPQLEGDTSIPDPDASSFPHLKKFWQDALLRDGVQHNLLGRIRYSLHDLVDFYLDDIPKTLDSYRKRLDLIGNDYYLAHIYRTLHWWTKPTHVSVLGDLVGSQWIEDEEFNVRGSRYWNRVFEHGLRVPDEITARHDDWSSVPQLGDDAEAWTRRVINIAGNHDVGYAGDLTPARFERFERVFGKANYELRFQLPQADTQNSISIGPDGQLIEREVPEIRIVVLNDMNIDTPASSKELQDATYSFLNHIISTSHPVTRRALFTLVLTHIPLHKEAGTCVDAPFFDFHDTEEFAYGVKEQNHLSGPASRGMLEGIFGMSGDNSVDGRGRGRRGLIITGHDHEGCDVYHYINQSAPAEEREWEARRWRNATRSAIVGEDGIPGLREITLRSMMGEFGGNAGLLSIWFDRNSWEWKFDFDTCQLGVQHWWWTIHILDLVTIGTGLTYLVLSIAQALGLAKATGAGKTKLKPKSKLKLKPRQSDKIQDIKTHSVGKGEFEIFEDREVYENNTFPKRSLKKKRSKRSLNGTAEPETPTRRPLASVFETPARVATEDTVDM
jgi:hypothetical protein